MTTMDKDMLRPYLAAHAAKHPAMQPQDVVKLCYQAAFGAEHLVSDIPAARAYFMEEYERTEGRDAPLCEDISPASCRVDIGAWKARGMPPEWLFNAFLLSSKEEAPGGGKAFLRVLAGARELAQEGAFAFTEEAFGAFSAEYLKKGMRAVHHSAQYREAERPAYRLVGGRAARLFPLLEKMAALPPVDGARTVAIDGRSASGKTAMAKALSQIVGAGVVHMDDFFLPLALRTEERLAAPGGNAHFERFGEEVLPFLPAGEEFAYGVFDCSKMEITGKREVRASPWRVVEGAYCQHPCLGDYAALRAFCDIDPAQQLRRIRARDGEEALREYASRWIPMEEAYIAAFGIRERADVIL